MEGTFLSIYFIEVPLTNFNLFRYKVNVNYRNKL